LMLYATQVFTRKKQVVDVFPAISLLRSSWLAPARDNNDHSF